MTTTLAPTAPKRWPINPEVIDSPACAMPQYATYRRHYWLVSDSYREAAAETLDALVAKAAPYARENSRIVRVPVVPHYDQHRNHNGQRDRVHPVGSAPWPGGTWTGRCGSTIWVPDPDRRYRETFATLRALGVRLAMQHEPLANRDVSLMQAWWLNGVATRHEPVLDGFWVECTQERNKHRSLCSALDLTWNWRDYAPWTDEGHNTQLVLDLAP